MPENTPPIIAAPPPQMAPPLVLTNGFAVDVPKLAAIEALKLSSPILSHHALDLKDSEHEHSPITDPIVPPYNHMLSPITDPIVPPYNHMSDAPSFNYMSDADLTNSSPKLDTADISTRIREILSGHNIGQRVFAKHVLGLSQGTVSELLSKPKHWEKLTEKGRESYRKMFAWAAVEGNVLLLKAVSPKKGALFGYVMFFFSIF